MYFSACWHLAPTQQDWRRGRKCRSHLYNPRNTLPPASEPKKSGHLDRFFWVLLSLPSPTRKLKTRPLRTCFLASGDFVYLPLYIPHLHHPRNPVRNDRVWGYCLISHSFPPPTRKLKTHPFRMCILALGEFAYLLSWIPHLHNPRNPVINDRVLGYCFISHQFPLPPENSKHVHYGRVLWLRVSSFTFPHTFSTSITAGFRVFYLIPPYSLPHPKMENCPYETCFLGLDGFVYILPYIFHPHNPRNQVRNDWVWGYCLIPPPPENSKHVHYGHVFWLQVSLFTFPHTFPTSTTKETQSEVTGFRVFCLIPPHISSPTWKWKTHLYGTCFLSSDVFVYIPSCLPHLHNPKNPVQMTRFRVFYLILPLFPLPSENGKHAHILLPSLIYTPPSQPKKHSQEWLSFGLLPYPPPISTPHRKLKTCPLQMCFLALGDFIYLLSCIPHLHNPRNPVIDCVLGYSPPENGKHV